MRTNIMQAKRKSIEEIKSMASARRAFTAYQFKQEASQMFSIGNDCHVRSSPEISKAETILILVIIIVSLTIGVVL